MIKGYKYRLNPTPEQIVQMEKTFGCCRYVYNWALDLKIKTYQGEKRSLTAIDLCKQLTLLKKDENHLWLSEVSNECLQLSIRCMDSAFTKFFREHTGFPKFKSKHHSKSSFKNINSVRIDFDNSRIKIPIVGWVNFYKNRSFEGKIGTITVSKVCYWEILRKYISRRWSFFARKVSYYFPYVCRDRCRIERFCRIIEWTGFPKS